MDKISQLISQMTIEEKATLLTGKTSLFTPDNERLGIKGMSLADGPHGVRIEKNTEENCTAFPCLSAVGATWSKELAYKMGEGIGKDCLEKDKDMILGPGVNMKRHPLCGRNFEYFSEDPVLTGELAAMYIKGVEDMGVGTSLKHFAANNQEIDRCAASSEIDERTLREVYLKPFEIAVKKSQPASVMCSYNKLNSIYTSECKWLYDILRDEWGYEGFVVSDWGAVHDIAKCLNAGLDLQMPCNRNIVEQIKTAIAENRLTEETVDKALYRILKFSLGLKREKPAYDRDAQHKVAREIAEQSVVLLRNRDNILPLTPDKKKICVIGEFAEKPITGGFGSSKVYPREDYIDSPLEALKKAAPWAEVSYIPLISTQHYLDESHFSKYGQLDNRVREADVVFMFVGNQVSVESEDIDRQSAQLDPYMNILIDTIFGINPNLVVVMQSGSAVIPRIWTNKVKGVVQMWYGGEAIGSAIADILVGNVNPSGKLSETFPLKMRTDIDYPGDNQKVCYNEKWAVGYRYYDLKPEEIWYPFGYGLSYTDFEYSDLEITSDEDSVKATLKVKNIGKMDGYETVQLYVRDKVSTASKPEKELKAFEKVFIKQGETATVTLEFKKSDIAYYNTMLHEWITECGVYDILVGASSRDIRSCGEYNHEKEMPYSINFKGETMMG